MPEHATESPSPAGRGLFARWQPIPLYLRILYACIVGAVLGVGLRECDRMLRVRFDASTLEQIYSHLEIGDDQAVAQIVDETTKNQLGLFRFFHPLQWAAGLAIPS